MMQRRGRGGGGGAAAMGLPMTQADLVRNGGTGTTSTGNGNRNNPIAGSYARRRKRGTGKGRSSSSSSFGRRICQLLYLIIAMGGAYLIGVLLYGHAESRNLIKPEIAKHTAERVLKHAKRLYGQQEQVLDEEEEKGHGNGHGGGHHQQEDQYQQKVEELLPYSEYKTLQYPFQHSTLVGLYFAASWCPMSATPTKLIDELFGEILLPPPPLASPPKEEEEQQLLEGKLREDVTIHKEEEEKDKEGIIAPLSIVYVSSDETEEQLVSYQKRNWISIPFHSVEERTGLKKEFSVCAQRELIPLEMERKFEIPTLILLDSETHGILTTNGIEDIEEFGDKVLDHWMGLLDLVRSLEDKYTK